MTTNATRLCKRCIQSRLANPREAEPGSDRCKPCAVYYRAWYARREARRRANRAPRRTAAEKLSGAGYAGRLRPFAGVDRTALK